MKAWQNWTGDETCAPAEFTMPRSVDDVVAAVRRSAGAGRNVRLVGAGNSFGDVVCTDGTLMTLDGLSGLLDVDTAAGQVRVAAGTRLNELNRLLDEHGLALANLGDIDAQSESTSCTWLRTNPSWPLCPPTAAKERHSSDDRHPNDEDPGRA